MTVVVPSLGGSLYLKDPQSIIAYTLSKYFRTPAEAVPILHDLIISLPYQVARFGTDPEVLTQNIQSDLQGCLNRIFNGTRQVAVNTNFTTDDTDTYSVTISIIYTLLNGEITQTGTTISLKNGRLVIPENNLENLFG